jgi:hypothetical protein
MGKPSYESAMVYLALSIGFLTLGPGTLSLDYALFHRKPLPATAVVEAEDTTDIRRRAA